MLLREYKSECWVYCVITKACAIYPMESKFGTVDVSAIGSRPAAQEFCSQRNFVLNRMISIVLLTLRQKGYSKYAHLFVSVASFRLSVRRPSQQLTDQAAKADHDNQIQRCRTNKLSIVAAFFTIRHHHRIECKQTTATS